MNPVVIAASIVLSVAFVVAFVRLLVGPNLADRVVAMDLMSTLACGGISLYAIVTNHSVVLDAVMVVALSFFLGTIAFAYYLERRGGGA